MVASRYWSNGKESVGNLGYGWYNWNPSTAGNVTVDLQLYSLESPRGFYVLKNLYTTLPSGHFYGWTASNGNGFYSAPEWKQVAISNGNNVVSSIKEADGTYATELANGEFFILRNQGVVSVSNVITDSGYTFKGFAIDAAGTTMIPHTERTVGSTKYYDIRFDDIIGNTYTKITVYIVASVSSGSIIITDTETGISGTHLTVDSGDYSFNAGNRFTITTVGGGWQVVSITDPGGYCTPTSSVSAGTTVLTAFGTSAASLGGALSSVFTFKNTTTNAEASLTILLTSTRKNVISSEQIGVSDPTSDDVIYRSVAQFAVTSVVTAVIDYVTVDDDGVTPIYGSVTVTIPIGQTESDWSGPVGPGSATGITIIAPSPPNDSTFHYITG